MTQEETARYTFEYDMTPQDFVDFNLYAAIESPRAKKNIRKTRMVYAGIVVAIVLLIVFNNVRSDIHTSLAFINSLSGLYLLFVVIYVFIRYSKKYLRKRVERKTLAFAEKEKNAYAKHAVLSFYDDRIHEKSDFKEETIHYDRICRYHIGENGIYIYTTPSTAFVLPMHAVATDETDGFIAFLKEKLPPEAAE